MATTSDGETIELTGRQATLLERIQVDIGMRRKVASAIKLLSELYEGRIAALVDKPLQDGLVGW